MKRTTLYLIVSLTLAVLTVAVLALTAVQAQNGFVLNMERYGPELLIYGFLTAFAVYLSVRLTESEISIAHITGILAFLSMEAAVQPVMLWFIFLSSVVGGAGRIVREHFQMSRSTTLQESSLRLILITSRTTLSFYASSRLYLATGSPLPVQYLGDTHVWESIVSLSVYSLVYTFIYFAIFALEQYTEGISLRRLLKEDLPLIIVVMLLPIPFAIVAAGIANREASTAAFVVMMSTMALIILGLNAMSRTEHQLRKQLNEMRSITTITQAMRGKLNVDTLLRTSYLQIAAQLQIDHFRAALYQDDQKAIDNRLVIRSGQEISAGDTNFSGDTALIEHVLNSRHPLLLARNIAAEARQIGLMPPARAIESWLGVPLLAGDQIIGAFVVLSYDKRKHFTRNDLRLLNIIAASASIAIENARLYAQKSEHAENMAVLNQVSTLLTGTLSLDTVLETIISSASTISDATAVAVYLLENKDNAELALAGSAGFSAQFSAAPPTPLLKVEQNNDLFRPISPLVVKNAFEDPRTEHLHKLLRREHKSAWIELPLSSGQDTLGVIALYFEEPHPMNSEQLSIVQAFATQSAQALHNARTFTTTDKALEQRIEQLYTLDSMGRMLNSSLDTKRINDLILSYAQDATRATRGALLSYSPETKHLKVEAQKGYPNDTLPDPETLQRGICKRVLDSALPVRAGDVRKVTDYLPIVPTTRSLLYTPILKGKEVTGIILLESDQTDSFSEEDTRFVAQIANQAIIAINNLQLFQRIREARDRLQIILDTMKDAIILVDSLHQVTLANPAISLIGLEPEQITGKTIDDLLADKSLNLAAQLGFVTGERLRRLVNEMHQAETWFNQSPHLYEAQSENGIHYVQRQIIPLRDETGKIMGMLMIFYNKTEEQELDKARTSISQMIVHDLRSPLTAVTTSLRLLQELVPEDSSFRPVIEKTTDTSRRAIRKVLNRVDALLDVSKMETGELNLDREPAEFATIADTVCVELSPLAHELDVKLVTEINENLPFLYIDTDKVERMLTNLVDNALKYTAVNSTIRIRSHMPQTNGVQSGFVRIDVIDQGPGVPDDYKSKLFDRFVQIEGRQVVRRGVGLGLTFCKLIADAHGGNIWIEDNPEGGSIFAFTLPIARLERLPDDEAVLPTR